MKTVTFKNPKTEIKFTTGEPLNAGNLTLAKYEALIKRNPAYEKYFIVKDK